MKLLHNLNNRGSVGSVILSVIGVLLVVGLVGWAILNTDIFKSKDSSLQDQTGFQVPADWQTYRSEALGFSIKYPPLISVTETGNERVQFSLETEDPGTGVPEGFTLTITRESLTPFDSLEAYVSAEYQDQLQIAQGIQEPTRATFNDRPAVAYVVASNVGQVEHLYIAQNDQSALHISHSINDPAGKGYGNIV